MHLNLFRRLLAGLHRLLARLRLPGSVYYIGGPEALPPPLTPEEEKLVFQGLEEGRQSCRDILITHNPHHAHMVGDHFILLNMGREVLDATREEVTLEELTMQMAGGGELDSLAHELER